MTDLNMAQRDIDWGAVTILLLVAAVFVIAILEILAEIAPIVGACLFLLAIFFLYLGLKNNDEQYLFYAVVLFVVALILIGVGLRMQHFFSHETLGEDLSNYSSTGLKYFSDWNNDTILTSR